MSPEPSLPSAGEIWSEHHGLNRAEVRSVSEAADPVVTFAWLPARTAVYSVPLSEFLEMMWFSGEHVH